VANWPNISEVCEELVFVQSKYKFLSGFVPTIYPEHAVCAKEADLSCCSEAEHKNSGKTNKKCLVLHDEICKYEVLITQINKKMKSLILKILQVRTERINLEYVFKNLECFYEDVG
jgi:hypothetical protein